MEKQHFLQEYVSITYDQANNAKKDKRIELIRQLVDSLGGEFFQYMESAGYPLSGRILFLPTNCYTGEPLDRAICDYLDVKTKYVDEPVTL